MNAYVWWNGGICHVVEMNTQLHICRSKSFKRSTYQARNLGYNVTVFCTYASQAPLDAIKVSNGSYVLPSVQ